MTGEARWRYCGAISPDDLHAWRFDVYQRGVDWEIRVNLPERAIVVARGSDADPDLDRDTLADTLDRAWPALQAHIAAMRAAPYFLGCYHPAPCDV